MRNFVNVTWNNAAEQYNGYQQMSRHVNPNGTAAIHNYSDEALGKDKKKSSISIQDRILPQARRAERLTEQLRELVAEYQQGKIDIDEYTMLLSVVSQKRDRAIFLLEKAKKVKASFEIESESSFCLEKGSLNSDESSELGDGIAFKANDFKDRKTLSKVAKAIVKNDLFYFLTSSIVLLTALKLAF